MNKSLLSKFAAIAAAGATLTLCACSGATPMSEFKRPLPWQGNVITGTGDDASETPAVGGYEQLGYTVAIYDMTGDKHEIAKGEMTCTTDTPSSGNTASYAMNFTVTYADDEKAGADRGLTDTINSSLTFDIRTLHTMQMKKEAKFAERKDKTDMSYVLDADYFGKKQATATIPALGATDKKMSVPGNTFDNEMMLHFARATSIGKNTSTRFEMTNIFDSYVGGTAATYTMVATGAENSETLHLGDWVKDFGVEKKESDDGKVTYPVICYNVQIGIDADRHGPAYYVSYTEKPFVSGNLSHAKIPVKITYSQYIGTTMYRMHEYTLNSVSFVRQ